MRNRLEKSVWPSRATAAALAIVLAVGLCPGAALAKTYEGAKTSADSLPVALKGDTNIEKLTVAHDEAQEKVVEVEAEIEKIQVQIDEIEAVLPAQQAHSDAGMRQRYIEQTNPLKALEPLLNSESLGDFLQQLDYLEKISRANLRELNKTIEMKDRLDEAKSEQDRLRDEAASEAKTAKAALALVQTERAQRQASGQEAAISQAREIGGEASVGVAYDGGKQPDDYREAASQNTEALKDGADWRSDRDEFIEEWGERIDDYLKGTPLAGQGENFAASAWKWNVDPRWSPAISFTESSNGRYCIRPHNAWGWGAADSDPYNLASEWGSWEEAIDAHVKGLSKGYGYTITMRNARKYCPNTWQSWYNRTLGQMAKI